MATETKPTTSTTWYCKKCSTVGTVRIESSASVPDGVEALKEHHAFRSPKCEFDLAHLRLVPEENDDA